MSRLTSIKRIGFAMFAAGGLAVSCRAAQPGDAPPLAPRPEPVSQLASPIYRSSVESMQARDAGVDATRPDAAPDAPAPDARMPDAAPAPRDARVPDAGDSGAGLPPVPDASLPPNGARPLG